MECGFSYLCVALKILNKPFSCSTTQVDGFFMRTLDIFELNYNATNYAV